MMPRMQSKMMRGESHKSLSDRLFISNHLQDAAVFSVCASLLGIARQFDYPTKPIPEIGLGDRS